MEFLKDAQSFLGSLKDRGLSLEGWDLGFRLFTEFLLDEGGWDFLLCPCGHDGLLDFTVGVFWLFYLEIHPEIFEPLLVISFVLYDDEELEDTENKNEALQKGQLDFPHFVHGILGWVNSVICGQLHHPAVAELELLQDQEFVFVVSGPGAALVKLWHLCFNAVFKIHERGALDHVR